MLAAGLKGIEKKIEPPEPVEEDVFDFDDAKLAQFYIKSLPSDLGEALEEFEQSKFMKETLGEHAFNKYLGLKLAEWTEFNQSVSEWERERYMDLWLNQIEPGPETEDCIDEKLRFIRVLEAFEQLKVREE